MITPVFCLVLLAFLSSFLTPLAVAFASPSPPDSVHFSCQLVDREQFEQDQSIPAAKRLQDLNVGDPRTVRLIYYVPDDRTYRAEVVEEIKTGIREVQTFFADRMEAHGHGRKTFTIETDDQSAPIVHRVDGGKIGETFDTSRNIFLIVVDDGAEISHGATFLPGTRKEGITAFIYGGWDWFAAAHELGHAFYLGHDFRTGVSKGTGIMSYGRAARSSASLSACAAELLSVHPYFNSAISIEDGTPPTIELTSATTYPVGSQSVPIRLRIKDSEGLHQVILSVSTQIHYIGGTELKACRRLANEDDSVIEFTYDGIVPSSTFGSSQTSFSNPLVHKFSVMAVDTDGNRHIEFFTLRPDTWEYHITTITAHSDGISSFAFSPDGTILAASSTSYNGEVKFWDVETRADTGTILYEEKYVQSVAFSPDGTILALGTGGYGERRRIDLWDVAARTSIGPFVTEPAPYYRGFRSIVFSPDGTKLASVMRGDERADDRPVKLWDVVTREIIDTFEGSGVAFSPDGTILVTVLKSEVNLWDVATRTHIATIQDDRTSTWIEAWHRTITSVAFSPDGTTLAIKRRDNTFGLWNLVTQEKIGHYGWPDPRGGRGSGAVFSPDGSILASTSTHSLDDRYLDTEINLFEMTTKSRRIVGTLSGHTRAVTSAAFSPDGKILASTERHGTTIRLWDTSEWAGTPVVNHPPTGRVTIRGRAKVGETLEADASAVGDPDGPLALEFSYQWLGDLSPIAGAKSQTYTLTENEIGKTIRVRANYIDGLGAPVYVASGETEIVNVGICGRTTEVQTAILDDIAGISDCAKVTDSHLAAITDGMDVTLGSSVKAGDFHGLTGLTAFGLDTGQLTSLPVGMFTDLSNVTYMEMYGEQLTTLPAGAFDGLTSLTLFSLAARQLTALPVGVFDPLTNLTQVGFAANLRTLPDGIFDQLTELKSLSLRLRGTQLTSMPGGIFDQLTNLISLHLITPSTGLPDGIFDQLTNLTTLSLGGTQLTSLPDGIFDRLTKLTTLDLGGPIPGGTQLTMLPEGINRLTNLTQLDLSGNQLSTIPDNLFSGLSSLTELKLYNNAVNTLSLTVSLEKVGNDKFKAVAPSGAPFDIVLPVSVTNGTINGGATALTIPTGSVESGTLTVFGTTFAVTVDISDLPELPADTDRFGRLHSGYALAKSADLPLTFTNLGGATFTPVCDRTPQVRDEIVEQSQVSACGAVTEGHLGAITGLGLGIITILGETAGEEITTLQSGDFDGLTGLTTLYVSGEQLSSIPAGVFDDLISLETLFLTGNFSSLPGGVFDGLTGLTKLFLTGNFSSLPDGVFDKLTGLTTLSVAGNFSSLPDRIFDKLTGLTALVVFVGKLNSLPDGVFHKLTGLNTLLVGGSFSRLPDGVFDGLTSLTVLELTGNLDLSGITSLAGLEELDLDVDPLLLTVSLEQVGQGQFKAVVPTGAPFAMVLPITVASGSISGGAASVTVPVGSVESDTLTVTRTPGTTAAVTVDIGILPGLPTDHSGYSFAKSADLPLEVIRGTTGGQTSTDFNGDGATDFADFFLFIDAYGGTDARFDLDGSGTVDFVDFFKFIDTFDQPGQAKLVALAREMLGLPDGPELRQNTPNPFNSETVISWFLLEPGPARVEVFALTGQRVAMLHHGPSKAGYHRVYWDGRDDRGRPLASGVYLYRLVTTENVQARKLTLLR